MSRAQPAGLWINDDVQLEARELTWRFSRSSGPGGQGVNTTDSRVQLIWDLEASTALSPTMKDRVRSRLRGRLRDGKLALVASEHRSQYQNRRAASRRLAQVLDAALAPPPRRRRPSRPSRGATERRIAAKRRRGQVKGNRRRPNPEE